MANPMQFGMTLKSARMFSFDSPRVKNTLDKNTYWYLRYQGMNIRRTSRKSVMTGRWTSPDPGPATRKGSGLAIIRYWLDRRNKSVIVGPIKFDEQPWREMTVPEALEVGGWVTAANPFHTPQVAYIESHPYMVPARDHHMTRERRRRAWDAARSKSGA